MLSFHFSHSSQPNRRKSCSQRRSPEQIAKQVVDEEFVRRVNMSKFFLESFKYLMNPRANNYRIFGHKSSLGTAAASWCAAPLVILIQLSAWPGCELDQQVACERENEPKQPQTLPKNPTKSNPDLLFSKAFFCSLFSSSCGAVWVGRG